jgi:hypothetical protein
MNLGDLKFYLEYSLRAPQILSAELFNALGLKIAELDVVNDVVEEVKTLRISNRDLEFNGLKRAHELGIIRGVVAMFKDKTKKNLMPIQYARDDNFIVEPLYRPQIFGLNSFTATTPATVPASFTLLRYDQTSTPAFQVDKEIIILTDFVFLDPEPPITELKITVDGDTQRPLTFRKDITASDLHIYELPFPVVADVGLRIEARAEVANATVTYLPIGLHIAVAPIVKDLA